MGYVAGARLGRPMQFNLLFQKNKISSALIATLFTSSAMSAPLRFTEACSPHTNIEIVAVGDVLLHSPLQRQAVSHSDRFKSLWSAVIPHIQKADIAYANLEGPIAKNVAKSGREVSDVGFVFDGDVYSTYPMFNYHPSLADDLKESGFDVVSTANNHSLDRYSIGADKTIDELDRVSLAYTGTRKRSESQNADFEWHTITQSKGRNIAWLACTFSTNGVADRHNQVLPCFSQRQQLLAKVTALANNPHIDAVIVTPHWGDEYQLRHNNGQTQLGRDLIKAGATAVIGTHAHVPQPWEKVTTDDGREGLIVYSTGNFVSNQAQIERRTAIMVQLHLSGPPNAKLKIRGAAYIPLFMQRSPLRTVEPAQDLSTVPQLSQQIWSNAYGIENMLGGNLLQNDSVLSDLCTAH